MTLYKVDTRQRTKCVWSTPADSARTFPGRVCQGPPNLRAPSRVVQPGTLILHHHHVSSPHLSLLSLSRRPSCLDQASSSIPPRLQADDTLRSPTPSNIEQWACVVFSMNDAPGLAFDPLHLKASAADYSSSDSEPEDEYQVPGLNQNDYNDNDELNPRKRKRRRLGRNNKERAALGVFGSDSEDERPSNTWRSKTLRKQRMSFVSTCDARPKEDDSATKYDETVDDEGSSFAAQYQNSEEGSDRKPGLGNQPASSNEDEPMAGVGLGFTGTRSPSVGKFSYTQTQRGQGPGIGLGVSSFLVGGFVPSSAGAPKVDGTKSGKASPPRNKSQVSAFSSKGKLNGNSFGARMMAKMGYKEGTGLGREGQGRNVIVEANLRPQGVGLGAVKEKSQQEREEEKRQAKLRGETVVDSDDEVKKHMKVKKKTQGSTFDSAGSTPRRQRKRYLTAEELKSTAPGLHIPEAFAPILDMTAPDSRILSSTSGIMTPTFNAVEPTELSQAKTLAKRAHADLLAFSDEWKALEERKTWVSLELQQREQELEEIRSDFEALQVFLSLINTKLASAKEWAEVVHCLQQVHSHGTTSSAVGDVAVAVINPFLRDPDWDPLKDPQRFAVGMKQISHVLLPVTTSGKVVDKWNSLAASDDGVYRTHHKATTTYESMMYKCWLPRILTAVRDWNPMDPSPLLALVDAWDDLLPTFVRSQLIDAIVRALEMTLANWNPRKKRQMAQLPHTWLFPWLQYLPSYHLDPKGTGLVADVRRKFRHLLEAWDFSRGVVPGLAQWKDVLGTHWRILVMSHILPSMGRYVRLNFRVDPADQEPYLPMLMGIFGWKDLIGEEVLGEVLVQDVFPMWYARLNEWMRLEEVDLQEVAEWYSWWRGVILHDMASLDPVRTELDKGLQVMNMV